MSIVVNSDFIGKYELTLTQYNTDLIDSYIERYEKQYLIKLLGGSLYDLFIADITNHVPTTAKYLAIFNPLYVDLFCGTLVSNGIKEMLIGFIYYHYTLDAQQQQTSVGVVAPKGENSDNISMNSIIQNRFNENVESFKAIQSYIQTNSNDYPTFNGSEIKLQYHL